MVEARIAEPDATEGFLLDGYPRSVEQADALKEMLESAGTPLDGVLEFRVDEDTVSSGCWRVAVRTIPRT